MIYTKPFNINLIFDYKQSYLRTIRSAQSVGAVEYTQCISAEGSDPINECLTYDIKPTDVKASFS